MLSERSLLKLRFLAISGRIKVSLKFLLIEFLIHWFWNSKLVWWNFHLFDQEIERDLSWNLCKYEDSDGRKIGSLLKWMLSKGLKLLVVIDLFHDLGWNCYMWGSFLGKENVVRNFEKFVFFLQTDVRPVANVSRCYCRFCTNTSWIMREIYTTICSYVKASLSY